MTDILALLRQQYDQLEVRGPILVEPAMATAFVWTQRQHSIVFAANRKYFTHAISNPNVAIIVTTPEAVVGDHGERTVLVLPEAEQCFYFLHNRLVNHLAQNPLPESRVHPEAIVEEGARIGPGVRVGKGARIGANSTLQGAVTVGEGAVIEPGVVIGCEGLFAKRIAGELVQIRHFGGVRIGAGAYIHSGAVIVRSAMYGESTLIGERVHVGVMSNIGHDAQIEKEAVVSSNTVIAGRARIGERAWIGASATISNAITVGQDARVNIGAVCIQDVEAGAEVSGNFALNHARNIKRYLSDYHGK